MGRASATNSQCEPYCNVPHHVHTHFVIEAGYVEAKRDHAAPEKFRDGVISITLCAGQRNLSAAAEQGAGAAAYVGSVWGFRQYPTSSTKPVVPPPAPVTVTAVVLLDVTTLVATSPVPTTDGVCENAAGNV